MTGFCAENIVRILNLKKKKRARFRRDVARATATRAVSRIVRRACHRCVPPSLPPPSSSRLSSRSHRHRRVVGLVVGWSSYRVVVSLHSSRFLLQTSRNHVRASDRCRGVLCTLPARRGLRKKPARVSTVI